MNYLYEKQIEKIMADINDTTSTDSAIENQIRALVGDSYSEGKINGYDSAMNRVDFWHKPIIFIWVALVLSGFYFSFMYFHNMNEKSIEMSKSELKACQEGKYNECMNGWIRVALDRNNAEKSVALTYENAYRLATGKNLIVDTAMYYHMP